MPYYRWFSNDNIELFKYTKRPRSVLLIQLFHRVRDGFQVIWSLLESKKPNIGAHRFGCEVIGFFTIIMNYLWFLLRTPNIRKHNFTSTIIQMVEWVDRGWDMHELTTKDEDPSSNVP